MNYACEAAIGAVSGLRTFTGPAIISEAANRKIIKLEKTPLGWLARDGVSLGSAVLAVGELIADKLPFAPDRTKGPALAARFIAGGLCGMAVTRRRNRGDMAIAAVVGGAAAVAAAYAGLQYRRHVKLPPVVAAVLEDTVAVTAGAAVVSALCR